MSRIFLLSPAHCGGKRAGLLRRPGASFELARQVEIRAAALGDVFTFCSGLYFRGKLSYAHHFATPPAGVPGVMIITPSRGLLPPDVAIGPRELAEFAAVPIDSAEPRFTGPLKATSLTLASRSSCEIVLLGSVATGKYLDTLLPVFGERLLFPAQFAGRGDMSRGALLLRSITAGCELQYALVPRPPSGRNPMDGCASPSCSRRPRKKAKAGATNGGE